MKIANSSVVMAAGSKLDITHSKQSNLQYWVGDRANVRSLPSSGEDSADISFLARKLSLKAVKLPPTDAGDGQPAPADAAEGISSPYELSDKDLQKIKLFEEFMYKLTGKRFKFLMVDRIRLGGGQDAQGGAAVQLPPQAARPRLGYGLIYDSVEQYSEKQAMTFQAAGSVVTGDGRAIDFTVVLGMSREFVSSSELHIRSGDAAVDPLVINLDGAAPALTARDFRFDLDNDGDEEQISRLMAGSGLLALDKNGDGAINDGGELFGPTLGDGFAELGQYDADGNGWIDENDPIYDKLRIWMADENGDMQLFALGQKGVGALYLGNVASAFDIKDATNSTLGSVRSTGVYLSENGLAGTLQHIDLTV